MVKGEQHNSLVSKPAFVYGSKENICSSTVNSIEPENVGSLMWVTGRINQQSLPVMVDTGATPNCLALRCVQASIHLKSLPRQEYFGSGVHAA